MDSTPAGGEEQGPRISPPPQLEGYHCERLLGRGGSSSVWLVRSVSGDPFALKVIDRSADSPMEADGVRREGRLLARLRHEHLLKVHDLAVTEQGLALRMDYAAGGSLLNLVSVRGPLPPGEVVTVLTPIAQVLAYLHDEGAAHGDVAPGNIVFTELGKPLLADFGTGRLLGEGGHAVAGTPGFQDVSPESDRLNTEADIYALAAVGWFALTGRVPGPAMQRPPLSLLVPDVPAELIDLINSGLDSGPEARPDAHEFARAAQRAAPAEPLDLVAAVHPDVLPDLRTRRSDSGDAATGPGRRRREPPRRPNGHLFGGRHSGLRPGGGAGLTVAVLIAVVLTVSGILLARSWSVGVSGGASTPPTNPVPISAPPGATTASAPASVGAAPSGFEAPSDIGAPTDLGVSGEAIAGSDPLSVLPHLSLVRERAFETADPELLELVNVNGSTAMAADQEAIAELAGRGHVLAGLRINLTDLAPDDSAQAVDDAGSTVAIAATATTSGYTEITATGEVKRTQPAVSTQQLVFILRLEGDRWRILSVHSAENG